MALIFGNEGFEGAGYEETWSLGETVGAATALDEDFSTSSVTGAPSNWQDQCLRCLSAGNDVYVGHDFGSAQSITYSRFEFIIISESLDTAGETTGRMYSVFNGSGVGAFAIRLFQDVSDLKLRMVGNTNGSFNSFTGTTALSLDTPYRCEVQWDRTNLLWEVRLDGTAEINGSLTASSEVFQQIRLGMWVGPAMELAYDNIAIDDADWPGAFDPGGGGQPPPDEPAGIPDALIRPPLAKRMPYLFY